VGLSIPQMAVRQQGSGGGPPAIFVSGTPQPAKVGAAYSFSPSASGGTPPYTFSLVAGSLPAGLSLNASTGLTGSPTEV
jgi:hypothetical protein